jgi:hypothetical protein
MADDMVLTDETLVEEGSVVETPMEENSAAETPAMEIVNLSSLINRYFTDLEKIKQQLKTQRDMFNGAVENDKAYDEQSKQVKDLVKKRNAIKQDITQQPAVKAIILKQKELKEEMKDLQDALSRYLERYQQVAKTNMIEGEDGEMREIVPSYKLVKKRG